ncbi:uncharacterized protein LOC120742685 [Simochromis diagramma]|uniref:uncharacterized protein LOC120742685 n=1 Tax=Simochromis diagramma TaxID=43689 RepID=UPI001A7E3130|nr:uncharacterized protein LOC120742685 [Simochromis diagramma]
MHISIWNSGLKPELQECNTCCRGLFHCPLCPTFNPTVRAKIEEHLSVHIKNALPFKDKMICRCRLPCRTTGHFHRPVCKITIIRRGDMARHLLSCQHSSMPSQPPLSGLLPAELSEETRIPPAVLFEEPRLPPKVLSSVSESLLEHSYALPSVFNKTAADGKSMKMTCPHCGLTLRSSGKLFAHWREEAKAVLEGQHVPTFRLKKHKFQEVSQEPAVVEDLRPAVQWVVQNKALFRGHVTMPKYLSLNQGDQQRVLRDMSEEEDTGARDLFLFVFQFAEDMELMSRG